MFTRSRRRLRSLRSPLLLAAALSACFWPIGGRLPARWLFALTKDAGCSLGNSLEGDEEDVVVEEEEAVEFVKVGEGALEFSTAATPSAGGGSGARIARREGWGAAEMVSSMVRPSVAVVIDQLEASVAWLFSCSACSCSAFSAAAVGGGGLTPVDSTGKNSIQAPSLLSMSCFWERNLPSFFIGVFGNRETDNHRTCAHQTQHS